MQFGIFDHLDRSPSSLHEVYEDRLRLVEAYDRHGFYGYHLAEHHATPLGCAPSPSVFLSAVAQRTKRLRFGPLVYCLPLYHPIRLAEEICMLDQMSGGRFQLGVGRGISPIELGFLGIDAAQSPEMYAEALDIILMALGERNVTYDGKHYQFKDVPMVLEPIQRPHPPLWYGIGKVESVPWVAANRVNVVCNAPREQLKRITDRYRAEWAAADRSIRTLPALGFSRYVVIADTDADAMALAKRAYAVWYESFIHLWRKFGVEIPQSSYPRDFESVRAGGQAAIGSVATVRDHLLRDAEETGANYLLSRFCFGDMTVEEASHSLTTFTREIMPVLRGLGGPSCLEPDEALAAE